MEHNILVSIEKSSEVFETTLSQIKPIVVVGIPAYNEEKTIAKIVLNAQKFSDVVVVCDDGSSDLTCAIAQRLGADVIVHKQNSGYGAAIQSIFKHAQELDADVLITIDGDGQHDPEEIPRLIQPIIDGTADVVLGSRFIDASGTVEMPLYRRAGVQLITKLVNQSSKKGVSDAQSGLRAYGREALQKLQVFENGMGASVEILLEASKHDLKICEVPSTCKYDNGDGIETSTENPLKHGIGLIMSIIKLIVEEKPLTVLGIPGIVLLIGGALFGLWMLQIYAVEHQIVTNIALASVAFVLMGFFSLSTAITLYAITRITKNKESK
jgi:glycosyltransferase involved in cell wall biosynthesis